MVSEIQSQIENINNAIEWVRRYKSDEYNIKFRELVEERRKLYMIADAAEFNPGIAAFGVSQVGKSYLMNCLLQKNGQPFKLKADGKEYNFIEEMNPKTKNTEATGVVTRFSSFSNNPELFSERFPILMRCITVADAVMIVSDSYYNDIQNYQTHSEKEVDKFKQDFYDTYIHNSPNPNSPLQPDDLLTIKSYFKDHVNNAQVFINSDFFDTISLVADRIPSSDWLKVFSVLWKSDHYRRLFAKLLDTLTKIRYSRFVYLTPQALLHDGINENTVMSVQCLNELFLESPKYYTDVYLRDGDNYTKIEHQTKSEICAVCSEIIIKMDKEYLTNTGSYCFKNIGSEVEALLNHGKVNMDILQNNDMLDFPGARSRKKIDINTLGEGVILNEVLLRGKVAFLFNKYNEAKKINILLFCHHGEKNEVSEIPLLLRNWIVNNIGKTIDKRRDTLRLTHGMSPLFYVGTKFNIDMERSTEKIGNEENAVRGRWQARFEKVLYTEVFNVDGTLDSEGKKIFKNWTSAGEPFRNSYILRDFKYSGPLASKLYENEPGDNAVMSMGEDYYNLMRRTFIDSAHVGQFFANPALSWDVCSSINNDGALYIIENLSKIAGVMGNARKDMFHDVCRQCALRVLDCIKDYFVPTDLDQILNNKIRQANSIFREMEFTCQENPEYFGHLINAMQLGEDTCFNMVHRIIPTLNETVTGDKIIKDYELIRKRCNNFEGCDKEEDKWLVFVNAYHFSDVEEAKDYLSNKGIDYEKLFHKESLKRQNSSVIAHDMLNTWKKNITGMDFSTHFGGNGLLDEIVLNNLVNCMVNTAMEVRLEEAMDTMIADYVNILDTSKINQELVADMISTSISDFVTDFGYSLLNDEEKANAKTLAQQNNLPCADWIYRNRKESYDEPELTALFNSILCSTDHFTPSYEASYNTWLEYMYVAFIAHIKVPDFDREANNSLKRIMDRLE